MRALLVTLLLPLQSPPVQVPSRTSVLTSFADAARERRREGAGDSPAMRSGRKLILSSTERAWAVPKKAEPGGLLSPSGPRSADKAAAISAAMGGNEELPAGLQPGPGLLREDKAVTAHIRCCREGEGDREVTTERKCTQT